MRQILTFVVLVALLGSTLALYGSGSKVVSLTTSNFSTLVTNTKDIWLVEFYAPWCGHCKNLAPEWEKAAKALDGIVKIGAVDMTTDQAAGSPFNVSGYPTLKIFGENRKSPQDYNGGRTAKEIVEFALNEVKKIALARLGAKPSSSSSSSSSGSQNNKQGNAGANAESEGDVVILTEDNFDELVLKSKEPWFLEFYAPWCGHCKNLTPEWAKLATNMKPQNVRVGKIDSTVHGKLAQRFGVSGYPTIKLIPAGATSDSEAVEYNGGRDSSTMGSWAIEQRDKSKPVQFTQLLDQKLFDEQCTNHTGVCVIFFLPSIYESTSSQRRTYLDMIEEIATSNKRKPFTFLWSQGGDQYDFEEKLSANGSGYPSAIAISSRKNVYSIFKGSFKQKDLESFINRLLSGGNFSPLPKLPKVVTVKPWDGKDKVVQEPSNTDL